MNTPVEKPVVTCFLEKEGRILLLRRSDRVGSYRGCWAAVSGYMEQPAEKQALTEITEETGLRPADVELVRRGETLAVADDALGVRWLVHPFLFHVKDASRLRTDWEHTECRWVLPEELERYETVPGLAEALDRVLI